MLNDFLRLAAVLPLLCLSACGTVSDIKPAGPDIGTNFSKYSKIAVLDFRNAVPVDGVKPEERSAYKEQVDVAARNFSDRIAAEIRKSNAYSEVVREPLAGSEEALVVSGQITRYVEGNAFLRFFIGMGAGSSYFDATIDIIDNKTGSRLGTIIADKNSWALGGGLAAGQTVEKMMQAAAEKTAEQLVKNPTAAATP